MSEPRLWSVTLTLAGDPVDVGRLRAALDRLLAEHPFLSTVRYSADRAELRYWDEADGLDDAAAMALRLWGEHRASAGLPPWRPVGLEVVDRSTVEHRVGQATTTAPRRSSDRLPPPVTPLGDIAAW